MKIMIPLFTMVVLGNIAVFSGQKEKGLELETLLPELENWKITEETQKYFPGTLFEYINGAAEAYLSYNFNELFVAQYKKINTQANMSLEIYDMGNEKNSFGIYSAERYPDNNFIEIGTQGYLENETLNFISGQYYVKLVCFDCEAHSGDFLCKFSMGIIKNVQSKGEFPPALKIFPGEGLIPNSEKYILKNFMGYSFLHDGYMADYSVNSMEFSCFIIEGEDSQDADQMLFDYLEAKESSNPEKVELGYHIKDRYYENIFIAKSKNYIFGVLNIKAGFEETGKKYLEKLGKSMEK